MRAVAGLLIALLALGGCVVSAEPIPTTGGTLLVPVAVDCSILYFFAGERYCKPVDPLLPPQYCTRSLGSVDCWDYPNPFGYYQRQVTDGPHQ